MSEREGEEERASLLVVAEREGRGEAMPLEEPLEALLRDERVGVKSREARRRRLLAPEKEEVRDSSAAEGAG